jgi:D-alanyl-D-alanine carboxypeptidase/D-alanyl-D-alanine-endopeptidase (penicillin-binding protein 4)
MRNTVLFAALFLCCVAASAAEVPTGVTRAIAAVTSKPIYAHSPFGIFLADRSTGETLIDQSGEKMFVTGSIMKTYSTASALAAYGPEYRFRTPVYRTGSVNAGLLRGNLVLVASGDFSFGLRDRPDGTLTFNSFPQIDHNYADTGFPGPALVPNSHPLSALDELARKVRAAGIRRVDGNVAIDDRLFAGYNGWPDGLIAPIWVNENVIDITATPMSPEQPAKIDWRPRTAAVSVISKVTTAAPGTKNEPLSVKHVGPNRVEVSGQIAADAKPTLVIAPILHPADFARTAFIEALARAGVSVAASAPGLNPVRLLPNAGSYNAGIMVAQHVSPPLSQFVKVILKVSYNRGADLMVCLVAAKHGSRNCTDGLAAEVKTISALGVSPQSTIVYDGAGSEDNGRTSPADEATFLRTLFSVPWGHYVHDGMAILGVDGTQAMNGVGTPAAGKVRIKDGTRLIGSPSGQVYLPAKTQVGYIDAKSGRQLVYGIFLNDIPTTAESSFKDFQTADRDEASVVEAIQADY